MSLSLLVFELRAVAGGWPVHRQLQLVWPLFATVQLKTDLKIIKTYIVSNIRLSKLLYPRQVLIEAGSY